MATPRKTTTTEPRTDTKPQRKTAETYTDRAQAIGGDLDQLVDDLTNRIEAIQQAATDLNQALAPTVAEGRVRHKLRRALAGLDDLHRGAVALRALTAGLASALPEQQ